LNIKIKSFTVTPENSCLETLSPLEMAGLAKVATGDLHALIKRCVLAVLYSGHESDDVKSLLTQYHDFDLFLRETPRGVEVEMVNVPGVAFVHYDSRDGELNHKMIEGLREHVFSVIRDLAFIKSEFQRSAKYNLTTSQGITDAVFLILRNAGIFSKTGKHKIVTCWGGHTISEEEYLYSLEVGNECGLRFIDVITGCGPGAMRGPMEGATIGHAKQRMLDGRYIGITEPGIIASEPPNPIVNPLVIMPDIEKRLEAFVRLGQGVIVFPGGVGTLEEIFYLLGVLTAPENKNIPFPMILTGPASSASYWKTIDSFVHRSLGDEASKRYQIVVGNAESVAQEMNRGLLQVKRHRDRCQDSYYFNTSLHIPFALQKPFTATHQDVADQSLDSELPPNELAFRLRRIFSAIVSGNVRPEGIAAVEEKGPFTIKGDRVLLDALSELLGSMADQKRMKRSGDYSPCWVIR